MTCHILLPVMLNVKGSAQFSQALQRKELHDEYLIDFSQLERAFPFAILLTVASIREFVRKMVRLASVNGKSIRFKTAGIAHTTNPVHGYLAHIGFFQDLGINIGRHTGEAWGSEGYVPIRHIKRAEIIKEAASKSLHYGEVLIKVAESLAVVISRLLKPESHDIQSEYVFKVMSYSLREILRNSIEHSDSDEIIVCAQSLPRLGCAEVAILDHGIGVHSSLAGVHGYRNAKESILGSVMPGVSSKLDLDPSNKWGNSGFGLYTTRRMCTYFPGDQFAIASSGMLYSLYDQGKAAFFNGLAHNGTTVMLKILKHDDYYFESIIENIIDEGEAEAKIKVPGIRASKMSKVLR